MRSLVSSFPAAIAIVGCIAVDPVFLQSEQGAAAKKTPDRAAASESPVAIVEFGSGDALKWADVKAPQLSLVLTLESRSNTDLAGLTLDVTPLRGSGESADVLIDGRAPPAAIDKLAAGRSRAVTITATLPVAVTYWSYVRLRQSGRLLTSGTLEIVRVRGAAPIEVQPIAARIVELGFWLRPLTETFETSIVGTGGKAAFDPPTVRSREYREEAAATAGIAAPALHITTQPAVAFDVTGQPVPLVTSVAGITRPGRYDVTLAVGGAYTPTAVPIVFYARQSKRVAAFWIFLGVALSFLLRFYGVIGRPVLLNRERLANLYRELDTHAEEAKGDPAALAVVNDVRHKLADRWNALSARGQLTDAAALDVYDAKIALLPVWLALRARVRTLQPPSLRKPFETELATAEEMFRNSAATHQNVLDQVKVLDGMPTRIAAAVEGEMHRQLAALREQLPAGDPRFDEIQKNAGRIKSQLGARHLNAAELDEAARQLEAIQRDFILIRIDDLAAVLAHKPVGVSVPEWQSTAAAISESVTGARKAATAHEASEAFRIGLTLYLRVAAAGLAAEATNYIRNAQQHADKFKPAKRLVDQVVPLINQGSVGKAWAVLNDALNAFRDAASNAGATLGASDDDALAAVSSQGSASSATKEFDILSVFGGIGGTISHRSTIASYTGLRLFADVVATVVILLAAVLLGVKTLWVGNLTWGGWAGCAGAFLWGLAFDQFTHAGVGALLKKG